MNIYERAIKLKLRFDNSDGISGVISTEDLQDLPLNILDIMYKQVNNNIKESEEESYLATLKDIESTASPLAQLKLDLIKHTMESKITAINLANERKANEEEAQEIMEILASKDKTALQNKSRPQLQKRLAELNTKEV